MRLPIGEHILTSGYGMRGGRMHNGLDLVPKNKTVLNAPIYACEKGKVIYRGQAKGYGYVLVIKLDDGKGLLFAHLHTQGEHHQLKKNSLVNEGQVIARIGQTTADASVSVRPHLHFEYLPENLVNIIERNTATNMLGVAHAAKRLDPKIYINKIKQSASNVNSSVPQDKLVKKDEKEKYYSTIQIETIGNKLYALGRGAKEIHLFGYDIEKNNWQNLNTFPALKDRQGWDQKKYYKTIQMIQLNNKLYIFGRGANEIHLFEYDPSQNSWKNLSRCPAFSNALGWDKEKYYKTIQLVTLDNKLYVFGRGGKEIHLFEYNPSITQWEEKSRLAELNDLKGWEQAKYYNTIHTAVANNKLYVCGRGAKEIHLFEYDPKTNNWKNLNRHSALIDSDGWCQEEYYSTVQMTAMNNYLYILGRGEKELHLFSYDTTANQWHNLKGYPVFTDAENWNKTQYYSTIQMNTIGNNLYVFGRGAKEIHLFEYNSVTNKWRSLKRYNEFRDDLGWDNSKYYRTIQTLTVADKLYIFGRGANEIHLFEYNPKTDNWKNLHRHPVFRDDLGWGGSLSDTQDELTSVDRPNVATLIQMWNTKTVAHNDTSNNREIIQYKR